MKISSRYFWLPVVCFALLVSLLPAAAQATDSPAPGHEAIAQQEEMAGLIGHWAVQSEILVDGEWRESEGFSTIDWHLGERGIRENFTGRLDDQIVDAYYMTVYSKTSRRWDAVWGNTLSIGLQNGIASPSGNSITVNSQRGLGAVEIIRMTDISEDSFTWQLERAAGFNEPFELVWTRQYTRVEEDEVVLDELTEGATRIPAPEETAQFDFFVGDWEVTYERLIGSEDPAETTSATDTVRYVMGGHAIEQSWSGIIQGEETVAWTLNRYNPEEELWEQMWWDSDFSGLFRTRGTCEDDACDLRPFYFTAIDENSFVWRWNASQNSAWVMHYTRAEDSDSLSEEEATN